MALQTVRLAALMEDWDVYPRQQFSSQWVTTLVEQLQEGATLPPPVIARSGMRIVDGWHRVRALRRHLAHLGSGAEITADVRSYESEADIIKDAIALNEPSLRGLPLQRKDRERAVVLLEMHGVVVDEISAIVKMPAEKVRIILVPPRKPEPTSEDARQFAEQARVNGGDGDAKAGDASRFWWVLASTRAIMGRVDQGDVTWGSDGRVVAALWELHDLIEQRLERPVG